MVPELNAALERTKARYASAPTSHRYYVANKLRFDPVTAELYSAWAGGSIRGALVDLGTGRGQFSFLLAELGGITEIYGYDHDGEKIEVATRASAEFAGKFQAADLQHLEFPSADTILLLDVLHYLPEPAQDELLRQIAARLRPNGSLFLRETNRPSSLGAFAARVFERIGRSLKINLGTSLHFRNPDVYVELLKSAGLTVSTSAGRGALNNVLIRATQGPKAAP